MIHRVIQWLLQTGEFNGCFKNPLNRALQGSGIAHWEYNARIKGFVKCPLIGTLHPQRVVQRVHQQCMWTGRFNRRFKDSMNRVLQDREIAHWFAHWLHASAKIIMADSMDDSQGDPMASANRGVQWVFQESPEQAGYQTKRVFLFGQTKKKSFKKKEVGLRNQKKETKKRSVFCARTKKKRKKRSEFSWCEKKSHAIFWCDFSLEAQKYPLKIFSWCNCVLRTKKIPLKFFSVQLGVPPKKKHM